MRKLNRTFLLSGGCVLALLMAGLLTSCEDKIENVPREDLIKVYTSPTSDEPVTSLYVATVGETFNLYVDADVDFDVQWQDGLSAQWLSITEDGVDVHTGYHVFTVVANSLSTSKTYTVRQGTLVFSAKESSLLYGNYITVYQGFTNRFSCSFGEWIYGPSDPGTKESTDNAFENWYSPEQSYGFTSTPISGEEVCHLYERYGYIQLGDSNGHGADIILPYNNSYRTDSELIVTFSAVAFTDPSTGFQDDNKFTVTAVDGGVIEDYGNSRTDYIELEAPYYDVTSPDYPNDMWNGTDFIVFIKSTSQMPFTSTTRIKISAGSLTEVSPRNSRIFIDNLMVYCRNSDDEEDLFVKNGGSGLDVIQ